MRFTVGLGMAGAALLLVLPFLATAAPPGVPSNNNPFPPSFYSLNPAYYGPYYPGQYQSGNVNPGIYNNYASPRSSGYGLSSPVPVPYSASQYGSSSAGYSSWGYGSPASNYGSGTRDFGPAIRSVPERNVTAVLAEVRVPTANAELWVEGRKTASTGSWRQFRSPPLVPGERYVYEFQARWLEEGKPVSQTRKVIVRAGTAILVDFTTPPS
jgi:uncharacterized protein (TIGR03000 family)